jgi:alpha-1,2-mannosyltransferase
MSTPRATVAHPPRRDGSGGTAARVATVVAVAAAAVACLWWYGNRHDFFDLRIYVSAMRWWADGNDLYDYVQPDSIQGSLYFTYPPLTAVLLRPLAYLPLDITIAVITAATVVALAVTTWWLVAPPADRLRVPKWYATGLAVPLVLVLEPIRETLTFGQINMLLIMLILADLLFGVPRNARWAGVGLGLATALKLFPGIFILYLLATRRWRAAAVASGTAAGATLLAAALAPRASWQFWTEALWSTERVGRTAYTANQSLLGMLGRLALPGEPTRAVWLALIVLVAGWGLWRAARVARAGDPLAGVSIAGLVGGLVSPITWPHHVYWFIPAIVVLADAAWSAGGRRRRLALIALAVLVYAVAAFGVVSFVDFGPLEPLGGVWEFVVRDAYVLLALLLVAVIPARVSFIPQTTKNR